MSAVVTTLYYKDVYGGGDVPETAFPVWAMRAEERLCADTCGRSAEVLAAAEAAVGTGAAAQNTAPAALSGAVQHAVCAVAELLYAAHLRKTQGGALTGESVGSWRRSYAPASDEDCTKKIYAAEALYLGRTNLLYRGCARV